MTSYEAYYLAFEAEINFIDRFFIKENILTNIGSGKFYTSCFSQAMVNFSSTVRDLSVKLNLLFSLK